MPLMWYIEVGGTTVNFSLADVLLPIISVFILLNIKVLFSQKKWLVILYFAGLLFSLALSQFTSRYNTEFLHVSDLVMLLEIVKTIVVALYFAGAFLLVNHKNFKTCMIAISLGSIPVMVIGLFSYIFYILEKPFPITSYALSNMLRFRGTFEDPNLCALYFIIIFFVSLLNYKLVQNLLLKTILAIISLLSLLLIVITLSRGGWLAFAGAGIIFILLNIKKTRKESILVFLAVILLVLVIVNMDYWVQKGMITNTIVDRTQQTLLMDSSEVDRVKLMKVAFQMGNDNFFTGVGKGSFSLNSNKYLGEDSIIYKEQYIPHNTILGFYAQQGILGLVLFLLLPGVLLFILVKSRKQHKSYLLALFSGLFLHSMTINIENVRFVWFILGIMLAAEVKSINIEPAPKPVIKKQPSTVVLLSTLCACVLLYAVASVKLATNIYVTNGRTYEKQFSVSEPGEYILSFDLQTDRNQHSVRLYNEDTLIKQMDFRAAYGLIQESIFLTGNTRVVFISNSAGWMKMSNAYFYNENIKIPIYDYPLLPDSLQNQLNKKGLLSYREEPPLKKEIDATGTELNEISLINARIIRYSNLTHIFEFDLKCKEDMNIDYQFDLQLEYSSLSSLLPGEMQYNNITHRFILSPATTNWIAGKEYTVKTYRLIHSETFNLYGRYYNYENKPFDKEAYFPITYDLIYENQQLLSPGKTHWINVLHSMDNENIIHMTYNGCVETGRINLKPGNHTLTFTAQGSWLDGYPEIRIRDSFLNEVSRIILDGTMKDYTVEYYTDKYQEGISFVLELINYNREENIGDRKVLLKDTLTIE